MSTGSSLRKWIATCAMASMMLLAAPPVSAQNNGGGGGALGLGTTTTTLGAITLVGGGIALTIVLASNSGSSSSKKEFIRQNAQALQQDLTVGGGESVQDLAAAFQVEQQDYDTFARMLHERRNELVPLTKVDKLDSERADAFFRKVAQGMQTQPELRDDLRRISFEVSTEG